MKVGVGIISLMHQSYVTFILWGHCYGSNIQYDSADAFVKSQLTRHVRWLRNKRTDSMIGWQPPCDRDKSPVALNLFAFRDELQVVLVTNQRLSMQHLHLITQVTCWEATCLQTIAVWLRPSSITLYFACNCISGFKFRQIGNTSNRSESVGWWVWLICKTFAN